MLKPAFIVSTIALAAALVASPALAQVTPAASTTSAAAGAQVQGWWSALADPVLSRLIESGLDANLDVHQAHARIERSRALLQGAHAAFGPSGSATVGGRYAQASETESPGLDRAQRRSDSVRAGLEFSWEVDVFGRLGKQQSAAHERLRASQAELHGVRLLVSAEIAHAYFALIGAREQLELAHRVASNRERTVQLVSARAMGGMAAPVDSLRAGSELEAARAQVPLHDSNVRVALHRIAVLTGQSPEGFGLATAMSIRPSSIALAVPPAQQWLAGRPDLQQHEAELRARKFDVEAVRAEFYPRLTITGVLGFVAGSVAGLGGAGSVSWLGAPSLLAPIFDRPRIEARLAAARADEKQALAAYRQRILLATEEVENALARYASGQQQFSALQRRAQLAGEAERLARVRYEAGAADLLELLDAQRSSQEAASALSAALASQRQHLVAVFKGTGGGA